MNDFGYIMIVKGRLVLIITIQITSPGSGRDLRRFDRHFISALFFLLPPYDEQSK